MKNLAVDKRSKLTVVICLTVLALAGLWFGVIGAQQRHLQDLALRKQKAQDKLRKFETALKNAEKLEAEVADKSGLLHTMELGMATGDLYSWLITTVRQFKLGYKVEIPQFSPIEGPREVSLLPQFPYKQASVTIGGTGHYEDIGRFISDFENEFPYVRLVNLTLEAAGPAAQGDGEKLTFKVDVIALVKPANSLVAGMP